MLKEGGASTRAARVVPAGSDRRRAPHATQHIRRTEGRAEASDDRGQCSLLGDGRMQIDRLVEWLQRCSVEGRAGSGRGERYGALCTSRVCCVVQC